VFARFFIDRPIFAAVLSILVTLGGIVGLLRLPIALYPEITPPTIEVSTLYPGAHSQTIADTVAAPIEEQVNGVEKMMYMSSTSTNDGGYTLTVTFRPGVDLNNAQELVQSRVNVAKAKLPAEVQRRGVLVKKKSSSTLMIVNLYSPDDTRRDLDLSNFATIQLRDELARIEGVGDIVFLGQRDFSMRVWLNPEKLAVRNLKPSDVTHAIEQQNAQVAAGQIGQPPVPSGQAFQFTINTLGRLTEPSQFAEIAIKTDAEGRAVRMKDVAEKIELGAAAYDQSCTLDGKPSVALAIYQLPGSNAIDTAARVKKKMAELKAGSNWATSTEYQIVYDTTPFIEESVGEVFRTLRDAVILVALVMLLFLQSWRSAIIPLAAVPVAIIGTFGFMSLAGFSLNTLTLFGLVLAVGIVVDDAIVVVEAVEYHLARGMTPRDATTSAMNDVAGPVVAVGLVLAAVFVPCIFISGIIGEFFRQFAVTIAISTLLSAFNSLTLSPALCALLLKPHKPGEHREKPLPTWSMPFIVGYAAVFFLAALAKPWVNHWFGLLPPNFAQVLAPYRTWLPTILLALAGGTIGLAFAKPINWLLGEIFRVFNAAFEKVTLGYLRGVRFVLLLAPIMLLLYGGTLVGTWKLTAATPTGFIPPQDKGYLIVNLQLTDSSSLSRTEEASKVVDLLARDIPGVKHTVSVSGSSAILGGNAANFATIYVMLDEFENRTEPGRSADAIAEKLRTACEEHLYQATVTVLGAPAIEGLGATGGFRMMIEDRQANDASGRELQKASDGVVAEAAQSGELTGLFAGFRADTPWLELKFDREAAESLGVDIADVIKAMQTFFGSEYVNDFNRFGRTWQVTVQAHANYRNDLKDLKRVQVPNRKGEMVPIREFFNVKDIVGPVMVVRYNLHPSSPVSASPAPGTSSGKAITTLEGIANSQLEPGMKAEWTELALLQLESGDTVMWAFILSVLLVFLVLAAQYESWTLPLAVILVVPMCLFSAVLGVRIAHLDINIFTQIGFVVLVGLACKNAILIVEFARKKHESGMTIKEATLAACKLRLRPIVMTSVAFILGVVPLVLAEGAGGEMRHTLGTAVFAGMIGVTLFGVFLTPVFFFTIQWLTDRLRGEKA